MFNMVLHGFTTTMASSTTIPIASTSPIVKGY